MDLATHALASFALARSFFPRRTWPTTLGIVLAGTLADIDLLSALVGPTAYFFARRTFTHSLPGTIALIALAAFLARYLAKKQPQEPLPALLLPLTAAAILHLALDLLQSEGVALLWPFSMKRFAADCLPSLDLWILALLAAGILVPELFHLVTSEIGVREKRPRGRNGALIALALLVAYVGARALFHAGSMALLDPHSYRGESARTVAAYPDALSLLTWHGVVETQSNLCQVAVPAGPGRTFDPEAADCLYKPEASRELDAAQNSAIAQKFVNAMPFPRATVSRTPDGYEVVIRSMRDIAQHETRHRLAARILIGAKFQILRDNLVWANSLAIH